MIRLYVAATVALLAKQACGSARSTPGTTPGPTTGTPPGAQPGSGSASSGAAGDGAAGSASHVAAASGSAAPVARDHPSDQECDALFAHAVAVELAQRPADQQLAEPQLATIRAKLREQKLPACLQLSRATYRCMIAAPTLPALTTCS